MFCLLVNKCKFFAITHHQYYNNALLRKAFTDILNCCDIHFTYIYSSVLQRKDEIMLAHKIFFITFVLGTQIPCAPVQDTTFQIDLKCPLQKQMSIYTFT